MAAVVRTHEQDRKADIRPPREARAPRIPGPRTLPYLFRMPTYATLSEAVDDLQRRGYTDDLTLGGHCLVCTAHGLSLDPAAFEIDEFHRFEGMNDPDDQSIVYAIRSVDGRIRGTLVNAYGPDASALTQEMVRKLATHGRG